MKVIITMCHSNLMSMLFQTGEFQVFFSFFTAHYPQVCVSSYTATAPEVSLEGMNGYMETKVTFEVKDLERFAALYKISYVFPSDRPKWYGTVKNGILLCEAK